MQKKLIFGIFSLIFICLLSCSANAQGKVVFNEIGDVSSLFNQYIEKQKSITTIRGWRIQILSTDDRKVMEATRSKFSQEYPSIPINWKHISPYYQVRVGAYKTKMELMNHIHEYKKSFPAAIAVQDDIKKIDFISY